MTKFSNNIKYLRNQKLKSQALLAKELKITRNMISAYEEGRAEPNFDTLIRISEYYQLPIDALLKTDLRIGDIDSKVNLGDRVLFPVQINENNEDVIEIIHKEASAGYLQGYSDTEYIANLPIMNLSFLPTGKFRAFPIKGDSMYPRVKEGDFVVGKYVEDIQQVKNNFCYIILTKEDGLVYKRLQTEKIDQGYIKLMSDNKMYQPYDLHLSEVLEVWEFTVNLSLGQYEEDEINPSSIMNLLRSVGVELKDLKEKVNKLEAKSYLN